MDHSETIQYKINIIPIYVLFKKILKLGKITNAAVQIQENLDVMKLT